MQSLHSLKVAFTLFLLCAAAAISSPAQTFTTVKQFDMMNGAYPNGPLIQGPDGNVYGTTSGGGILTGPGIFCASLGCGTAFKITPAGTLTTLYSFCTDQQNCSDGAYPQMGVAFAADGNYYGTTQSGGGHFDSFGQYHGGGTAFKLTPAGKLTTLHSFCVAGCADGAQPSRLVQNSNGNFYGTNLTGGAANGGQNGTLFEISPAGVLTTLYRFCQKENCADGTNPDMLVLGQDGSFYGITGAGGTSTECQGAAA